MNTSFMRKMLFAVYETQKDLKLQKYESGLSFLLAWKF